MSNPHPPENMGYLCPLCTVSGERASSHSSQPHTRVIGRSGLTSVPQGKLDQDVTWGRRTIAVNPSEGILPCEHLSTKAVRGRAQTFLRTEQKYCLKIPFSDTEQSSRESHFTLCWEAEMPGEALLPSHCLAFASLHSSCDWEGGAVNPGIVFGLLLHMALYNLCEAWSFAKLRCS